MSFGTFATQAPVKVTMIFVAAMVLGFIALQRLPVNLFPDVRAPKVTTTVKAKGLSPAEVERRLCEQLERQLYTLRGVVEVETIARADQAVVVAEFTWDTPLDFAFLDVKKAVADVQRDRSNEIESVSVLRYDPNAAPVLTVALVGGEDSRLEDLRRFAELTLKPRFERLEGVANIEISGGAVEEVRVYLDEGRMLQFGLDVSAVVAALRQENVNATGGYISEGTRRYLLRSVGEFQSPDEVRDIVVKREGEAAIRVSDIARVEVMDRDPKGIVLLDGKPAVGLSFYREAEGNTVGVAKAVRAELAFLNGEPTKPAWGPPPPAGGNDRRATGLLPPGAKLVVASDQSEFIQAAIGDVLSNAWQGSLLAIIVLMIFLRDIRSTLIISVAIPVSVVATFNLMYFQGLTLNLMTLGGLALGVGMVVDNANVVLENIFRRLQLGDEPKHAAREGTREVSGAIIASTLTTVVVFLPIVYVRGVAGLIFREQALTVAFAMMASLVVALLLIPMLASQFMSRVPEAARERPGGGWMGHAYTLALRGALRARWLVVLIAIGSFVLAAQLLAGIPREFLPRSEQRQLGLRLTLPNGTPIDSTRRVAESVMGRVNEYAPAIDLVFARIGEGEGTVSANSQDPDGPNTADLQLRLHDWDKPTSAAIAAGLGGFRSSNLVEALKPSLEQIPGLKAEFKQQQGSILELLGTSEAPLLIEVSGEDIGVLTQLAEELRARLEAAPGLLNVRTNILEGSPEVLLDLDTVQLSRLGFDTQTLADTLKKRIDGEVAGQIKRDAGDMDIRVMVDYGTESVEKLGDITLRSSTGAQIPLRAGADFRIERGPREILRRHQTRIARVMADLAPGLRLSDGITRAQAALATLQPPGGYVLRYTGEEEQRAEAFGKLGFALALSIVLVYMVMASIFESFIQPLIILLTIPLSGVGVVGAFIATGTTLNLMGLIGVIMLGGIVVNNAIVLLDCVNQLRKDGLDGRALSARESILIGCQQRLRPVLMTTMTTLLGLVPMALGIGQGAEIRQAMAVAVLGGLASSTLLTLIVVPVVQSLLDSATGLVGGLMARVRDRRGAAAATGAKVA